MQDYESFRNSTLHNGVTNGVSTVVNAAKRINGANGMNGANGINGINGKHRSQHRRAILLSAKDEQACHAMAHNLRDYLQIARPEDEDKFFGSLAYTLTQRRSRFSWVSAQSARNVPDLVKIIDSGKMKPSRTIDHVPRLGYVFTGQGAQWYAMGRELIDVYPAFKACLLEADGHLKELGATWSLMGEIAEPNRDMK